MVVLGFDPGGIKQFGWCVAEARGRKRLRIRGHGTADSATEALHGALEVVGDSRTVSAAGIDSPLFWVPNGDREVDKIVRKAIADLGAPNVYGTVQQVNSLRGACLAQGMLLAHLLRRDVPNIRVTEAHPKALLWLLKVATRRRPVRDVAISDLMDLVEPSETAVSEHERDAVLGAIGALAMLRRDPEWRDLVSEDHDPFMPAGAVEYWMPIPKHTA